MRTVLWLLFFGASFYLSLLSVVTRDTAKGRGLEGEDYHVFMDMRIKRSPIIWFLLAASAIPLIFLLIYGVFTFQWQAFVLILMASLSHNLRKRVNISYCIDQLINCVCLGVLWTWVMKI